MALRKKPSPRRGNAARVAVALLLLSVAMMPFFAMKHVQLEAGGHHHGVHSLNINKQRLGDNTPASEEIVQLKNNNQRLGDKTSTSEELIQQKEISNNQRLGDTPPKSEELIQPVSCEKFQKDESINDPNRGIDEDTKRLTITDPKFYISLHSQFFDRMRYVHIMKQGEYYEKGLTQLFHELLSTYDTKVQPPPLVLDIGMNIGWFSLYSRAHGHDVAAFEPNPIMFLRVCESLEYNNWKDDKGFSLWNYGLGTKTGVFDLTMGKNPGGSSFLEGRLAPKFRKTMPVSVLPLDTIAIQEGWLNRKVSLMKVDVEGFEGFVFEGGRKLIYNGNVENILMENSNKNITIVGGMVDMLYDAGYRVNEIRTVNGDPYHKDWWHTFNPKLEERFTAKEPIESDQINFLTHSTSNIWWQHKRIFKSGRETPN